MTRRSSAPTVQIQCTLAFKEYFDFSLPSVLWAKRVTKFEESFECFCLCYSCLISFVLLIVCCLPCLLGKKDSHSHLMTR